MRPDDPASNLPAQRASRLPADAATVDDDTRGMPRVSVEAPISNAVIGPPPGTPAELSGMLLPSEAVTFASSPHPVISCARHSRHRDPRRADHGARLAAASDRAGSSRHHAPADGRRANGRARRRCAVAAARAVFGARAPPPVLRLPRRHDEPARVRGRGTVRPARDAAQQHRARRYDDVARVLRPHVGYGNLALPPAASWTGTISEMRDPVKLYREFEAVAQGVDGDHWTPAVRQTLIP